MALRACIKEKLFIVEQPVTQGWRSIAIDAIPRGKGALRATVGTLYMIIKGMCRHNHAFPPSARPYVTMTACAVDSMSTMLR